MKTKLTKS